MALQNSLIGDTLKMQPILPFCAGALANLRADTNLDTSARDRSRVYQNISRTFKWNAKDDLTGTILLPAAPMVYNGTGNLDPNHVQLIGYMVE